MTLADMGVRTTSFAASAALLGAAVIAAMSMSFTMMRSETVSLGPVVEVVDPPPPPPTNEADPSPIRAGDLTIASLDAPSAHLESDALPGLSDMTNAPEIGPPLITRPHWRRVPRDLGRYYPRRALAAGVEGYVELDCLVAASGRLNCRVAEESPAGWNFGDAARSIAAEHEMAPAMRDGVAIEGRYRMQVPFQLQ